MENKEPDIRPVKDEKYRMRMTIYALEARIASLQDVLEELVDIIDDPDTPIDSFTTQPAKQILKPTT